MLYKLTNEAGEILLLDFLLQGAHDLTHFLPTEFMQAAEKMEKSSLVTWQANGDNHLVAVQLASLMVARTMNLPLRYSPRIKVLLEALNFNPGENHED